MSSTNFASTFSPEFSTKLKNNSSLIFLVTMIFCFSAKADDRAPDPEQGCKTNPAIVGKCFMVKGRVDVYNGTPSVRIQPKGSRRILGVIPAENEIMPDPLKNAIGFGKSVYAEMIVCPMTKAKPKAMQLVCVQSVGRIHSLQIP